MVLGANTLTMIGGGTLSNTNALELNHANSLLTLDGTVTIGKASVTAASNTGKGLDVNENTTIQTFSQTKSSRIDIADGKSLTLTDTFEVPVDQTMEFDGDRRWNYQYWRQPDTFRNIETERSNFYKTSTIA